MTHYSHNDFHLGDNLIHLHFLRKMALVHPTEKFVHAVHECHIPQLAEAIEDVPNVALIRIEDKCMASVDVWKNAGATRTNGQPVPNYTPGFWEQHPFRQNYAWFYLAWFERLSSEMGLECPLKTYKDLWFDYPKIAQISPRVRTFMELNCPDNPLDFLVVNSRPCSGQCMAYNDVEYLTPLIHELGSRYRRVACTQPMSREHPNVACTLHHHLTISEIGTLSLHADHLVMVSTGPSWPTFNVWNEKTVKLRLLLLKPDEKVDYAPNLVQVSNREDARRVLVERGLL